MYTYLLHLRSILVNVRKESRLAHIRLKGWQIPALTYMRFTFSSQCEPILFVKFC
jgi:hypothetical protein